MSESQQTEWKVSWRDEYLKWICGFANAQGGILDIGRNDKGLLVGVNNFEKLLEDLPNKIRDTLGIVVDIDLLQENDRMGVRINVDPYPYPISHRGRYYYRSGSTKQERKGAALDKFLLGKTGKRWDSVPQPSVEIEDLDVRLLNWFRQEAVKRQRLPESIL